MTADAHPYSGMNLYIQIRMSTYTHAHTKHNQQYGVWLHSRASSTPQLRDARVVSVFSPPCTIESHQEKNNNQACKNGARRLGVGRQVPWASRAEAELAVHSNPPSFLRTRCALLMFLSLPLLRFPLLPLLRPPHVLLMFRQLLCRAFRIVFFFVFVFIAFL